MRSPIAFFLLMLLCSSDALAFGASGHEAVCEIAYLELTPQAKNRVDELIRAETDSNIQTFRDSCVWPDFRGTLQNERRSEHYINIPRYWTSIRYQRCYRTTDCLFSAIAADSEMLASELTSTAEKLVALKFLGHWIGDIHQPLHVSFADDRGGNSILVDGVTGCTQNGMTKLHAVWDTCIPEDLMLELGARNVAPDDDDRGAFGTLLWRSVTDEQRTLWQESPSPLDWANESLELARRPDVEYCILAGAMCRYSDDSDEYEEDDHAENEGMRVLNVTGDYEDDFGSVVTERMQAAGVRLGALLNRLFEN
jgi:S1/P1 Nuclease